MIPSCFRVLLVHTTVKSTSYRSLSVGTAGRSRYMLNYSFHVIVFLWKNSQRCGIHPYPSRTECRIRRDQHRSTKSCGPGITWIIDTGSDNKLSRPYHLLQTMTTHHHDTLPSRVDCGMCIDSCGATVFSLCSYTLDRIRRDKAFRHRNIRQGMARSTRCRSDICRLQSG